MNLKKILKKHSRMIGAIIAALLLYLAFKNTDFTSVWLKMKGMNFFYLGLSVIFMVLLFVFKGIRWKIMLHPIKKVRFSKVFPSLMIGYFTHNVLPFRMGEFMRVYYLNKKEKFSSSSLVGSVFAEKFFDGLALIMIAIVSVFFDESLQHGSVSQMVKIVVYILLAAIAIYLMIHFMPNRATRPIRALAYQLLKGKLYRKTLRAFRKFFHGFHSLHSFKILSGTIFYSLMIWVIDAITIYFLLLSFDVDTPQLFLKSFIPLLIINLSVMIPSGPGDIGMFHLAGVKAFEGILGLDGDLAVSITLILHFITILPGFILGGYYMFKEHIKIDLKEIEKQHE